MRAFLVSLAILIMVLSGCSKAPSAHTEKITAAKEKIPVLAGLAARKTVPLQIEGIGNVEPYTTVAVKSRVEGQLMHVGFHEGDAVAKGQLLFEIDPRPYQAQLRQAQANLARDRSQWEYARSTLRRNEDLLKKSFVSQEMLQKARTDVEVYAANIEADEAAVDAARLQVEYATIHAPISGRTGRVMVHQGNQAKADSILVVINQIEPVNVSFSVPEQRLPAIREAAQAGRVKVRAIIEGTDESPPLGRLSFIDNAVDATTGTIKLKATFDNKDQHLWAGQFVRVFVDLKEQEGVLAVPAKAVQTGPSGSYVFVIHADNIVAKRDIVVDRIQDGEAIVSKGLKEGERIVVDGQSRLVDGAMVEIKPTP